MGSKIGEYNAWLDKVQKGEDNAAKLLAGQLAKSEKDVSPTEAATEVMKAHLKLINDDNVKHFTDLDKKITDNEEKMTNSDEGVEMHDPGESSKELAAKLKTLDLTVPDDQKKAAKIAATLLSRDPDPKFEKNLAFCIRGKLWEDTQEANPTADPKELAAAYNNNLKALLTVYPDLNAPAVKASHTKSMADTFIALAAAAEKLDSNTAVKKLESKLSDLEAKILPITTGIQALQPKIATEEAKIPSITDGIQALQSKIAAEQAPGKKKALEKELEGLQAAQKDSSDNIETLKDQLRGLQAPQKDLSDNIQTLKDQKNALQEEQKNGTNPEKNEALAPLVVKANDTVAKIGSNVPLINKGPITDLKH